MTANPIVALFRLAPPGAELSLNRHIAKSAEDVWAAVSAPERLSRWMGVTWLGSAGPLHTGADFSYRFADTNVESCGRVLRFDPPHLIEHTWFDNVPPGSVVSWRIDPEGEGCRLTLTHIFKSPEDAPRTAAGWTSLIEALANDLGDRTARTGGGMDTWRAYRDDYARSFPPEAARDGRLIAIDGKRALRFERMLNKAPDQVWAALVEPAALARWLQADATIDPFAGGRFHLVLGGGSSTMMGVVREWAPPRVLEYTWQEKEAGADSIIRFEIQPREGGSRLILTHVFPGDAAIPDFASGWHWHLDALDDALDGVARTFDRPRWQLLKHAYTVTL